MPNVSETEIYYAVIVSSLFFLLLISIIITAAFFYYKEKRIRHEEIAEFQNTLLRTQLEIQEQTFKTISQEIHDNIGQMLSLAKLNLNRVNTNTLENEKDKEKIEDAKELVSKAIQDLRDLSRTLNTETITSVGLLSAMEMELQLLRKAGSVEASLEVRGIPLRLDAQKELILFRIFQEGLHNVIKHASASVIQVTVIFSDQLFEVVIADNGRGFDSAVTSNFGSGLRNMQSRSKLIGAGWDITSSPETGTRIHISLPLNN